LPRPGLIKAALTRRITSRQGAQALHLTIRQFQCLKRRFREGGAAALRAQIATWVTTVYSGLRDVHLTEKLRERQGLDICRESIRRCGCLSER